MKVEEIRWDDELAFLFHGDPTVEDVEAELERMGYPADSMEIGPVERFRRWPGQWNEHIARNDSPSLRGAFKARLVQ